MDMLSWNKNIMTSDHAAPIHILARRWRTLQETDTLHNAYILPTRHLTLNRKGARSFYKIICEEYKMKRTMNQIPNTPK